MTTTLNLEILTRKSTFIDIAALEQEFIAANGLKKGDFQLTVVDRSLQAGFAGVDAKELIEITLNLASNVAIGALGNFLYEKLKNVSEKLWINSKRVGIDNKEIKKSLEKPDKTKN